MRELRKKLIDEFQDEEYRYSYAEGFLNSCLAAQIKVLREQRGLNQTGLAHAIGTKQAGISRLEDVNYTSWNTGTLRRIAKALGVRLRITFEEFGTLLDEIEAFNRESLQRREIKDDQVFHSARSTDHSKTFFEVGSTGSSGHVISRATGVQSGDRSIACTFSPW